MNGFADGQKVLSPDGCSGSDKISEDQQRKSRFLEHEAEIMRLSADPLLLHQYLDRFGSGDCEENLIAPLRRPSSSMGGWKNPSFLVFSVGIPECQRGNLGCKARAFHIMQPRLEVSLTPEPFCASDDDRALALNLAQAQTSSRLESSSDHTSRIVMAYKKIRAKIRSFLAQISQPSQP
jgi:hypothetical protein